MQFGSAPVVGALSFVRLAWHRPWRWKSSREPVTASDLCSEGGGSYPGRFLALRLKEQRRLPPSARSLVLSAAIVGDRLHGDDHPCCVCRPRFHAGGAVNRC